MKEAKAVAVRAFGQGRTEVSLPSASATAGEAIRLAGLRAEGVRVAVNGQKAGPNTTVIEGDSVTIVPRVEAG